MSDLSRRNFLFSSSAAMAGSFIAPGLAQADNPRFFDDSGLNTGKPKVLHYKSIPGFLSAEQISPHYNAHYAGALRGYRALDARLESSVIDGPAMEAVEHGATQRAIVSKSNSVVLHELYFDGMGGVPGRMDPGLSSAIKKRFGSVDKWAEDFKASAKSASGWAMLTYHPINRKLYNVVSDKHSIGVLWMASPLVVIDVYEHAFYVDYKNNKAAYIEKFVKHINWQEVSLRYKAQNIT